MVQVHRGSRLLDLDVQHGLSWGPPVVQCSVCKLYLPRCLKCARDADVCTFLGQLTKENEHLPPSLLPTLCTSVACSV